LLRNFERAIGVFRDVLIDLMGQRLLTYVSFSRAHRYEKEFESVQDVFELQRNLNNAFAYDLVPSPSVVIAALRAARRVNDFPTAVRIFEGTSLHMPASISCALGGKP
jgi:hypothetical protein